MQYQPAEVNPVQPADHLPAVLPEVPRHSEMLAPLSQILWGDESRRTTSLSACARLPLDLGKGLVSDDPQLLSLAWALSR